MRLPGNNKIIFLLCAFRFSRSQFPAADEALSETISAYMFYSIMRGNGKISIYSYQCEGKFIDLLRKFSSTRFQFRFSFCRRKIEVNNFLIRFTAKVFSLIEQFYDFSARKTEKLFESAH